VDDCWQTYVCGELYTFIIALTFLPASKTALLGLKNISV